jgi:hypothetical protein
MRATGKSPRKRVWDLRKVGHEASFTKPGREVPLTIYRIRARRP